MDTLVANFLNSTGNLLDHRIVKFGSGAGPMVYRVFKILKLFFVTKVLPSLPIPPITSVTQVGSPENNSL